MSAREVITPDKLHELTRPLIGLPVSRAWRGYGSAIFLELGDLMEVERMTRDGSARTSIMGQATIMIEWSWRVERPRAVAFGSWSGDRKITNGIGRLDGQRLIELGVEGRLPELAAQLSGGYWLHSFTTYEGQLQWCLFFNEMPDARSWIDVHNGVLQLTTSK